MEHGGVVVWYNTTDPELIDNLEQVVLAELPNKELLVLAPYSDMEDETVALTSWGRIDKFPASDFSSGRVTDFIDAHVRRFNPENF